MELHSAVNSAVRPPARPLDESAGWVGYYARRFLHESFDLVDLDGWFPTTWLYWKSALREFRVIEEKPTGQHLHDSERRVFDVIADLIRLGVKADLVNRHSAVFIVWNAEHLGMAEFPIKVQKWGYDGKTELLSKARFDRWLLSDYPS